MTNLILIDCHDLGQHLGAYGRATVPSPALDALAARGVRFNNSFGTAPQCCPSRASLYTGRYSHANGMFGLAHEPFNWRMHAGEKHLAALLRDAGFFTAQAGTQHVTLHTAEAVRQLGFVDVRLAGRAAEVADRAVAFLSGAPPRPFFLNIGFTEPHRDADGLFKQAPPDTSRGVEVPPYLPQSAAARAEFAELQGAIGALDAAIGRIMAALDAASLTGDTWVIFTTDHGLAMPRAKCTLYDPGLTTALIMAGPFPGATGGLVRDELVSNVDIVPTLLDVLGLPVPVGLHGRSFAALLRGGDFEPRARVFFEKTFHTAYEPQRGVRTERFKLIWNLEAGIMNVPGDVMRSPIFPEMIQQVVKELPHFELYDLAEDPGERANVFGDPRYGRIADDLRASLASWMRETGDPLLDGPIASPFFERGLRMLTGSGA